LSGPFTFQFDELVEKISILLKNKEILILGTVPALDLPKIEKFKQLSKHGFLRWKE
jgi:hypothetical protein